MKKHLLISAFCLLTFAPLAIVHAEEGVYGSVSAGISFANKFSNDADYAGKRPKTSGIYSIAAGYKFNDNFRSDLSLSIINNHKFSHLVGGNYVKQKISSVIGMLNGYVDIGDYSGFIPYITAAGGISSNKAGAYSATNPAGTINGMLSGKTKSYFAWSVGLGVAKEVMQNLKLDLSYKYWNLGKASTSSNFFHNGVAQGNVPAVKTRLRTQTIMLGLRVGF